MVAQLGVYLHQGISGAAEPPVMVALVRRVLATATRLYAVTFYRHNSVPFDFVTAPFDKCHIATKDYKLLVALPYAGLMFYRVNKSAPTTLYCYGLLIQRHS